MRSYRLLCLAKISNYLTQKKRGIVLLSIPRVEALALPIVVEQTTLEPTPIWKSCPHRDLYSIIDHIQQDTIYAYKAFTGFDIVTPGTSTVDHIRDNNYEFARFDSSQTQRQINAFYYVLTLFPPIARLLPRKLFGFLSFQLGVGCLLINIE